MLKIVNIICGLVIISGFGNLKAQVIIADNYNAFLADKKTPLFVENFTDNKNNWYLGIKENVWFENLQDSTLFFQSYENNAKEDFKEVFIDQLNDFEIEIKMRIDKGVQNKFNGLQWGKNTNGAGQFNFFFNGQGQFTIDKFDKTFTDFVPVTASSLINNYTYNTLTVRKINQTYYFFINQQLVHKMPFEPFFGNGIGFQVGELSSVQIDYLHVYQLETNGPASLPMVSISEPVLSSLSGKLSPGETINMKFIIKNTSTADALNLKLIYTIPNNIMLLESQVNVPLKAGSQKEVEMVFYINKNINSKQLTIGIKPEGADFIDTNNQLLTFTIEQNITQATQQQEQLIAGFRSSNDPLKGLGAAKAMQQVTVGKYYALIIGIDSYTGDWKPLRNAVNDAKAVEKQLRNNYEFQSVRTLYNEQATRANIIKEYEWLMTNTTENDNVLIFYSGHGDYNDRLNRGFWVPVDASTNSVSLLISNSDIQAFLGGIKSKHTFLIADACFSGDIFRGKTITIPYENSFKYYNQIYAKPSRTALTSGGIEPVMDGGKDGHSVFTYYLLKSLINNQNQFFDASQLYNDLKVAVINNSNQTPGFSPIINTGDEGGQFIFIKKQNP